MWKEDKRKYVKSSTYSAYALILENHILPTFGDKYELLENEVQEFVLQKLQQRLSDKKCKGYTHCTKNGYEVWSKTWYIVLSGLVYQIPATTGKQATKCTQHR